MKILVSVFLLVFLLTAVLVYSITIVQVYRYYKARRIEKRKEKVE